MYEHFARKSCGLSSMVMEAARRACEGASDEERTLLPRCDGGSWIELYHHLQMLRARPKPKNEYDKKVRDYADAWSKCFLEHMNNVKVCREALISANPPRGREKIGSLLSDASETASLMSNSSRWRSAIRGLKNANAQGE